MLAIPLTLMRHWFVTKPQATLAAVPNLAVNLPEPSSSHPSTPTFNLPEPSSSHPSTPTLAAGAPQLALTLIHLPLPWLQVPCT